MEQKVVRVSTLVVVGALLLRLASGGFLGGFLKLTPQLASCMLFLQTGRLARPSGITFSPTDPTEETPPETEVTPTEPALLTFSAQEAELLTVNSSFSYTADLPALLSKPLSWDLTAGEPTVLIVHSHASESYAPTGTYEEISPYHTLDAQYNMLSVGALIAARLEAAGISVLHDTSLHDHPSYNASYSNSRSSIADYLEQYPSISLVLDLHRDSIEDEEGNQIAQTVFAQGQTLAPLMLVVGTDYGGLHHPQWRENLALALKLQTQLERSYPGICRNLNLRSQRFNQDLSPGALLVEVGTSGNTHQQALASAEVLAQGIIALARGSQ